MKKFILIIASVALIQTMLLAQGCLPEGITFETQEQIDNFQINYPGCTVIEGSIIVSGHLITNLNGLSVLTSIEGNLVLGTPTGDVGPNIEDISGLANLTSIGGNFEIFGCYSLSTLSGIENLTFVGGNLNIGIISDEIWCTPEVYGNALSNLSSLNGLTNIGGNLEIIGNALTNLSGLDNVTSVGGDVAIFANGQLTSLEGLNGLLHINNNLLIGACIYNGNVFTSSIYSTYPLTSLSGLENLTFIGGMLCILNNGSLSTCDVQSICDYLASPSGTITIGNNGPGCNSQLEVEEACEAHCLPEGITFETQEQIDSFQINYPGCTEIDGYVHIKGSEITNLNGLSILTSIEGSLTFGQYLNGPNINNLSGLDNLSSVGGDFYIFGCDDLYTLAGIENLTSVGGNLNIGVISDVWCEPEALSNENLNTISSLSGLTSIGGDLEIIGNESLTNLSGLENVISVGGNVSIASTHLTSLEGLQGLSNAIDNLQIGYGVFNTGYSNDELDYIGGNYNLTSLSGLENLTSIGGDLPLYCNEALSSLAGLVGLTSIGGALRIASNPALINLTGLENVTSIGGWLSIIGNAALTNLMGLENLTHIGGGVQIHSTPTLVNFTGLNNLSSIGGQFQVVYNNSLSGFSGLESLTTIGGIFVIDGNGALVSLTGLDNVTTIGGYLNFYNNNALTSLTGLENIESGSIGSINITGNNLLSTCDVQSVCDYLDNPNGTIDIYNNAPGCNNPEEVLEACFSSLNEVPGQINLSIFPNPFNDQAFLSIDTQSKSLLWVNIYNVTGICVKSWQFQNQQPREKEYALDLKDLPAGIYLCRVQLGNETVTQKLIKY